jgi:hypothetical protein
MVPMMFRHFHIEYVGLSHSHGIPYSSWSTSTCVTRSPRTSRLRPTYHLFNKVNDLVVGYDLLILSIYHASELDFLWMSLTVGIVSVNAFLDGCLETLPNVRKQHQHCPAYHFFWRQSDPFQFVPGVESIESKLVLISSCVGCL